MADEAVPVAGLAVAFASWGSAFDRISGELADSWTTFDETLADADSEEAHTDALAELARVGAHGEQSLRAVAELTHRVEALHTEWRAARRYDPDVLSRLAAELGERIAADPVAGAQDWLTEIFDALDTREWDGVGLLAREVSWPDELAGGAQRLQTSLARWSEGKHVAGLELMEQLGEGELDGWHEVLDPELRSRAYRLAAWIALRRLKQPQDAERYLSHALEIWPYAGRMHAERAAYFLSVGELDRAATDAQRSVELAEDDAAGYLELGIWAELSGDYEDADQFYRKTLTLLPTFDVVRLSSRVSLMDPPGRLLTRAAEVLLESRRPRDALRVAEQALHADLRGPEIHPQAATHRVRGLALEQLKDRSADAAAAAVDAGKLYAWNGDVATAIERFERAAQLDDELADVGWLLADARLTTSLPLGATVTDQAVVTQARETWERWVAKVGPPKGEASWAYLTRAMIADLGTQHPDANRLEGIWEALLYVEKAILQDRVDATRWGYAAQYLRYVHLDELAMEAVKRGYEMSSGDRQVLAERLAQFAYRGMLEEAEDVAEELVIMFGNDPWVSAARAWLAIHSAGDARYSLGLERLELPIAGGNDPSWYYEMRALCHAGLQDIDAARADCRHLLEHALPVDGMTKCRLAMAALAVDDAEEAARWSREAWRDPTSRAVACLTADALIAFACGETDAAAGLLARAAEQAANPVELRDVIAMTRLRLRWLAADAELTQAREHAIDDVAAGPVAERVQSLEQMPPSADQELEHAIAGYAGHDDTPPVIGVTLLAIKARRAAQAGRLREAATCYQELLSSSFEPEATLGLTRALRRLAREQAAAGDVQEVKELTERMTALGNVSGADVATTVASALEQSGSPRQARQQLEDAIAAATDDREKAKLRLRAGGLALADDDLDAASAHFQAALEIARTSGEPGRAGQAQIRMALIGIRRDDLAAAREQLLAAARAWKDGGALDPTAALVGELHGLERLRGGRWQDAARQARGLVEAAVAEGGAPAELEPLRRELRVG